MAFFRAPLKQIFVTLLSSSHGPVNKSMKSLSLSTLSQTPCFSSTANLLANSLGLSPDSALKAAQAIRMEASATSDAVISTFKRYGFSSPQIVHIFTVNRVVLRSNPKRNIEPKLAFLSESGISSENLTRLISVNPFLLDRSLQSNIMPGIQFLKSFFGCSGDMVSYLSPNKLNNVLRAFSEAVEPNVETLRNHGVPHMSIHRMLIVHPRALSIDVYKFSEIVKGAKEMGLDASGMRFIHAIRTFSMMTEEIWISKVEVFKSLGWSDEQVDSLVSKRRGIMGVSKQRLWKNLNLLSNNLNWGPREVLKSPSIILRSAEKYVLPRYHVLQKLASMHLLDKNVSTVCEMSEDKFLNSYVRPYLDDIPELLDLYQKSKLNSRN